MISFAVRMNFRPEDREEITDVLRHLTLAYREEPGCVTYVPLFLEGEACTIVIWEQYQDEAAVEKHRATRHFATFAVGGLYQKMLERHVENFTAVL